MGAGQKTNIDGSQSGVTSDGTPIYRGIVHEGVKFEMPVSTTLPISAATLEGGIIRQYGLDENSAMFAFTSITPDGSASWAFTMSLTAEQTKALARCATNWNGAIGNIGHYEVRYTQPDEESPELLIYGDIMIERSALPN